jgi:4-hydroxy-tetrahydrodipicolinate reductase
MLKIGLIGYGQMGRIIKKIAKNYDLSVVSIIDPVNIDADYQEINKESTANCDVLIDFSTPKVIMKNIKKSVELDIPLVVGTTGWYENLNEVEKIVLSNKGSLIYATNFSIGVNILFKIAEFSSNLFNLTKEYDVAGTEIHHNLKKDIPSGTAETLANIVLENYDIKEKIVYQPGNREIKENELHFTSLRLGNINGIHEIIFDSNEDQVSIKHNAKGREGFAKGALIAAKYIYTKKGLINFNECFSSIIEEVNNGN